MSNVSQIVFQNEKTTSSRAWKVISFDRLYWQNLTQCNQFSWTVNQENGFLGFIFD